MLRFRQHRGRQSVQLAWQLACCLAACSLHTCATAQKTQPLALVQSPAECAAYAPLYKNIDNDLEIWQLTGISQELMAATIRDHATLRNRPHSQKGIAVGFVNGTAVLLQKPELSWAGHHVGIWFIYLRVLLELQQQFGAAIPNVDFVISTIDRPVKLLSQDQESNQPVFRFCKTDAHPDVLIPCFHFYVKGMVSYLLEHRVWLSREYPWIKRAKVLFGRFSPYNRHLHIRDPYAQRIGANGKQICTTLNQASSTTVSCAVRQHFVEWSKTQDASLLDVDVQGRMPMRRHGQFRFLAHLDGQGLSSRLEQLLTLGSVVFKEESGYRGFYHSLLRPFVHYVPIWPKGKGPEDAVDGVRWALQNDEDARAIAAASQDFAHKFFTRKALSCYWYMLLSRFARLQAYQGERQSHTFFMTVEHYLDTVAKQHNNGREYNLFIFANGTEIKR